MKRGDVKGLGLIVLLPICCLGLPLLVAASVGVAAVVWIGAIVAGAIAVAAVGVVAAARVRRRRSAHSPSLRMTGSRS